MATIMRWSLSLSVIVLFCFISSLNAEDYVSKDIPPDALVAKAAQTLAQAGNSAARVEKILGKTKNG